MPKTGFKPLRNPRAGLLAIALIWLVAVSPPTLAATIGASLLDAMDNVEPADRIEVIVSFEGHGPLTERQVDTLAQLGLDGIYFQALPMAGVLATPEQILALDEVAEVRSLWLNERLELTNQDSRALTGVDRMTADPNLRNDMGFPYSGEGIGVMVNDSGIDATHPDLMLGEKTVQNVFATANLNAVDGMLPITWVEDVPDTDIGSGHGTHVAGTVAGTGAASGGEQAGVAPGAHLIGYGSGGVLFILDTLGAFDYALVNQFRYNIRVINNSWGSPGDTGTDFDPDDPTNIATKMLADRNFVTVFAAGNSGSGEDTIGGNFIKAPWVVTVAAANKNGTLADFSSRGKRDGGGVAEVDGESFEWFDRPNVAAPGVDILSTMSNTNALADPVTLDYGLMSGTSMAAPHVAGIVALMLEANPRLHWSEVIEILEATATNIPAREGWEAGAGMVNAHAAVAMAAGARDDYGLTVNLDREFNANVAQSRIEGPDFELYFDPLLEADEATFTVAEGLSTVIASANVSDNTVALVLTDPEGNRYGSAISLPLLGPSIAVTAPAVPGEWTITVRGIGSVSGVALDPLGVTNGTAVPGTIDADVDFMRVDGFKGLDDLVGHPARGIIEFAVTNRLADARPGGVFEPDQPIRRAEMAEYLTMGAGIRQFRPTDGSDTFFDVLGLDLAAAEASTATGGALRDTVQAQDPIMLANTAFGRFKPEAEVRRTELAYALIQSLGLQAEADEIEAALGNDPITVEVNGERVALEDDAEVPAGFRGHVQLALDLEVMGARFELEQGPFDLQPTLTAFFEPLDAVSRAGYAFAKVNFFDRYRQVE